MTAEPAELEVAFGRIAATRMAGMPVNNPALAVEAVGFRLWEGKRLGVLVLPWAMNLVLLPAGDPEWRALGADCRQRWRFPAGEYDFMGGDEPECGPFQFCSLFSPAFGFADMTAARAAAAAVLAELFAPATTDGREAARLAGQPVAEAPMSRRGFLGAFGLRG